MGLRADAVANGQEAIHALENIPYDLVLMDDYIAKPVNTGELARVLTRRLKKESVKDKPGKKNAEPQTQKAFTCTKPVFDREDFMKRMGHDRQLAERILKGYLKYVPENIKSLKFFIKQGQNEGATREAHSIKGMSANTGCLAISEVAEEMETAGRFENLMQMKTLMPELERQFEICMAEIKKTETEAWRNWCKSELQNCNRPIASSRPRP